MSTAGCRPEVATRILQILLDDPDVVHLPTRSRVLEKPAPEEEKPPRPAPALKPPPGPTPAQLQEEARARRRARARELFLAGHPIAAIAAELNVTRPTVATDVADLRTRRRVLRNPVALRARQQETARLFREGWSIRQIMEKQGLREATVRWDLRTCGIRTSDPASRAPRDASTSASA